MNATRRRGGFTIVELLVIIVILAVLLCLMIPAIQEAREAARRATCIKHFKQLGLGFQNMESALGRFPPSCHVKMDAEGKIVSLDGWSWCVDLLPYMENRALWTTLDTDQGVPLQPNADGTNSHAAALATVLPELICPSFRGNPYVNMKTKAEAITNYKALGATHLESLNVASPSPTVPRYAPDSDWHPDGAIYPGSVHGINAFKSDGSSRTAILVETVEQTVARWTVGNECALVGLPPAVTFARNYTYYHPSGYTANSFWDESTIPPDINKTYLEWDYETNPYSDGGVSTPSADASGRIKYGPSSDHVGVTNHGFADGSVHAINNQIDAALYFFVITRTNSDPVPSLDRQ